jgi:hypothetical protein
LCANWTSNCVNGPSKCDGAQDALELESIGCRLLLADLHEKVEFEPAAPAAIPAGN